MKRTFKMVLFLLSLFVVQVLCAAGDEPLPCTSATEQPNWPIYHIINNVSKDSAGLHIRPLNDANAIFQYKGIWHVMNQAGGGIWTHAISTDLAHWAHIPDALVANKSSPWDHSGPCDGTASFPVLGGVYNGSVPIIMCK
eukprot:m.347742 g.347742  ORF g.347742 m.347742 type:complete len:140 (+) comp33911_c0_seq1:50-469(+)